MAFNEWNTFNQWSAAQAPLPTVNAGADTTSTDGETITLSGASASDYDTLQWSCLSGQSPTFSDATVLNPTVTFNESGTHTLQLTATSAQGSVSDSLDVNVAQAPDTTKPVITLLGSASVTVVEGDTYNDAGATASDNVDGDITANIVTVNPVDVNNTGSYTVTYNVSDSSGNAADEVTRTVNVVAQSDTTKPVITLLGSSSVTINEGEAYVDAGATALDDVDGDISANIVTVNPVNNNAAGTYTVTYNVTDAAGNAADEVTRTVNVISQSDTTPPVITLNGNVTVTLTVGDTYTELGATAVDNQDGDISADIVITGTVDTSTASVYSVRYNVTDSSGNSATEVVRTVFVTSQHAISWDSIAPTITLNLTSGDSEQAYWPEEKDPTDRDYWDVVLPEDWLGSETIQNATAIPKSESSGLVIESLAIQGNKIRMFLSSGDVGTHSIEVTVTTSAGRVRQRTLYLVVREK